MSMEVASNTAPPQLAPLIAAQLNYLLIHSPLTLKVDQVWSGCKQPIFSDRFTLLVPYCLDYTRWDIIYNAVYPLAPPDVIFAPEDENFHPLSYVTEGQSDNNTTISSLLDWNIKDPSRLLSLVHGLRDLYVAYQRKRVGEIDDARLKFELSTLISREGIEVCLISESDKPEEVKFAVPLLDMDLNKLVHGCTWKHQQKIYVQVVFLVSKKYSSVPSAPHIKLVASSELKSLFSIEDIKLPVWLDGMCMAEYLPMLEENLKLQIMEAVASLNARRRFIEALALLFGRPLEADPIFCRRVTMLASSGVFTFLVHFYLSTQFPKQQPVLILQSSQHFDSMGIPIKSPPISDCPWSPRWDASQMVERIFEFMVEESANFKKYCSESILSQH
ncbi:BRCA1-A complex subunit BRE [Amborella trichopoda]|uniref:BRISC and BRCA1-A complex member 2 n=1 Tax=Amborella trichopoda TaxID=13333 RepID=W1PZ67_AMBTC|nr:BRCA1-A complex subunit BRE [Amborella trichopoda]XP_011626093.1 BRCA1-A complex subunit BRE [Amborella trichopoda]ERN13434.1 hypothetical protein AMTR_s00041p00194980 [Amborella trichopoda]|eukprot:XP_006851967.1 BRCA1-A complex subunit BRE [Amborella trichopoda]